MASNTFGNIFKITTFGESHGRAIGVVIDGCPANMELSLEDIQNDLDRRAPGKTPWTSPRTEKDQVEICSGLFEGKTTGAPITLIVFNHDSDPSKYEPIKATLRPGHANYTYIQKYGIYDYRGGGRASARETLARVAAGAVAKKMLQQFQISPKAYLQAVGNVSFSEETLPHRALSKIVADSPIFCPDPAFETSVVQLIEQVQEKGDSIGGIVAVFVDHLPPGLGDPIYEKLEANIAKAMLSIPASKGIEFGDGFMAAKMQGSQHNDLFIKEGNQTATQTNHSGGTLGGISNGMPLQFRVAFKPTSSLKKAQPSIDLEGNECTFELPKGSRHDPCVAIRAVPVVEAMTALVLADALLLNRSARL